MNSLLEGGLIIALIVLILIFTLFDQRGKDYVFKRTYFIRRIFLVLFLIVLAILVFTEKVKLFE
ncbi:hypothetical protein AFM12_07065 [Jiulongibacter sediminis]|uniref:HIG1 domain-containing protein n=1 Tax=Jiulongibacter sediminis TaxID=1605367 RepID=A0A0P7BCQ6_9BACT|nr:hypothetical protein AFM12_07065 [Jiulongibacter sediminis]TBX24934.1 hypothetical protein TK44_07070 [Jiulongibacter sediminis]